MKPHTLKTGKALGLISRTTKQRKEIVNQAKEVQGKVLSFYCQVKAKGEASMLLDPDCVESRKHKIRVYERTN